MRQSKDCTPRLLPLVAKGVRGLGKHPPVISSTGRFTDAGNLPKCHNGGSTLHFENQKQERWYSVHGLKMINQWVKIMEALSLLILVRGEAGGNAVL